MAKDAVLLCLVLMLVINWWNWRFALSINRGVWASDGTASANEKRELGDCPKCGSMLVERGGGTKTGVAASIYSVRHINHFHVGLTYLLTPCRRALFEKLTSSQLDKKFPAFYGSRRFITAFTSARHLSLSSANSIKSMPSYPTSWRSFLILSSHLRLSLPSVLFLSGFPTRILYTPILSSIRATCSVYLILLYLVTRKILDEECRLLSSLLCNFLHSHITSSILGPNILLSTLLSNTLNLRSSLNVNYQVSHPCNNALM